MASTIGRWTLVLALGFGASSCGLPDQGCPLIACIADVKIELEPPLTAAAEYAISVEVDGEKLDCWVPVPTSAGKAACATGGNLSIRDLEFSPSSPEAGDLARITIVRQPKQVRLVIAHEETLIVDESLKPRYGDERMGSFTCEGEPLMCRVGRATLQTR